MKEYLEKTQELVLEGKAAELNQFLYSLTIQELLTLCRMLGLGVQSDTQVKQSIIRNADFKNLRKKLIARKELTGKLAPDLECSE